MTTRDERAARAHFDERYAAAGAVDTAGIESRAIGGAWGANGFTCRPEPWSWLGGERRVRASRSVTRQWWRQVPRSRSRRRRSTPSCPPTSCVDSGTSSPCCERSGASFVPAAFLKTQDAWFDERRRHAAELMPMELYGAFEERQCDNRRRRAITAEGLICRSLFVSDTPGPRRRTTSWVSGSGAR